MVGALQLLTVLALLLSTSAPSFALPIASKDKIDPMLLIATGLLNQEKRLQAIEQKLSDTSSTSTQAEEPTGVGLARIMAKAENALARNQQSLEERQTLPMDTRMTYLEEDVEDNRHSTEHRLHAVYDLAREAQRVESEDMRVMHNELANYVAALERELNSSIGQIKNEISTLEGRVDANAEGVESNLQFYYRLNNGLHATVAFIRYVEYSLSDRVYDLETQVGEILETLKALQRTVENNNGGGDGSETQPGPSTGEVGDTGAGGGGKAKVMSDAEKRMQEWIDANPTRDDAPGREEVAKTESAAASDRSGGASLIQDLLSELNKYNM
jgi:phage host-nuclease inhibitor protein Gam